MIHKAIDKQNMNPAQPLAGSGSVFASTISLQRPYHRVNRLYNAHSAKWLDSAIWRNTILVSFAYLSICQLAEGNHGFVEPRLSLSTKVGSDFGRLLPELMDPRREYIAKLQGVGSLSLRSKSAKEADKISLPILFTVFQGILPRPAVASAGEKMIEDSSNKSAAQKRNYQGYVKKWFIWHLSAFLLGVIGGFAGYSAIKAITD